MHARHDPIHIEEYRFVFASKYSLLWFHIIISLYRSLSHLYRSSLYTPSGRTACIWRTINKVWPAGGKSLSVVEMQHYCRKNVCVTLESRVTTEGSRFCHHILIIPQNCKIQYRKVFKNTIHWNPVGLGCIPMPPCWLCHLQLCVTCTYCTHRHTCTLPISTLHNSHVGHLRNHV